jgi:hypothetical protein
MYISVTCDYFMHDFVRNEQKNRCDGLEAAFFRWRRLAETKLLSEDWLRGF